MRLKFTRTRSEAHVLV